MLSKIISAACLSAFCATAVAAARETITCNEDARGIVACSMFTALSITSTIHTSSSTTIVKVTTSRVVKRAVKSSAAVASGNSTSIASIESAASTASDASVLTASFASVPSVSAATATSFSTSNGTYHMPSQSHVNNATVSFTLSDPNTSTSTTCLTGLNPSIAQYPPPIWRKCSDKTFSYLVQFVNDETINFAFEHQSKGNSISTGSTCVSFTDPECLTSNGREQINLRNGAFECGGSGTCFLTWKGPVHATMKVSSSSAPASSSFVTSTIFAASSLAAIASV